MPLETGTYINDLVQSNPDGADDRSQGDNHIRLLKQTLKNTFPGASKAFRFPTSAALATSTVNVSFPADQNKVFPVNATGGNINVNLPDPTAGATPEEDGFSVVVFKSDNSSNRVIINPTSGHTINGSPTGPQLSSRGGMALLIWCKLAAQWFAITPNILGNIFLFNGVLQSINSDNTAAVADHLLLQRGSGAGDSVVWQTVGDASNGVLALRLNIGGIVVAYKEKDFVQYGVNFFVGPVGAAAPWGVLSSGHEHHQLLSSPATPPNGVAYSYFKTDGVAYSKDSAGVEHSLEAGQVVAIIEDRKSQGTDAQTFSTGSDQTRQLNTLAFQRAVPGGDVVSLASNQFTINQAGTFEIEWEAPAVQVNANATVQTQSILHNVTAAADVARSSSAQAVEASGGNWSMNTRGRAIVVLSAAATFEIRQRVSSTTINGGMAANLGTEVYTQVTIRRA